MEKRKGKECPLISLEDVIMLSYEAGLLSSQLSWLLSAETATTQQLHTLIQPRAASLPLFQQNDLALTASGLLSSLRGSQNCPLATKLRGQLLELLEVLASQPAHETSGSNCSTVSQTASWALQQQRDLASIQKQTTGCRWVLFAGAALCSSLCRCNSPAVELSKQKQRFFRQRCSGCTRSFWFCLVLLLCLAWWL